MRRRPIGLWSAALAGYAFLYVPLLIVVVYSFNDSRLNAEWVGFTFDWYDKLFHNQEMLLAAGNSLLIGLTASAVATVLGTMAGLAMYRYRTRLLSVLVLAPIAIPESLTEAARDCGASPLKAFCYITLPLIMPGVIAGALMAFTLSIDDFVITFFTAGAGTVTLPLQIYSMIKIAVTPEVNAVSTLLMLLTLALIIAASKLSPTLLGTDEENA